jgi:hypothetical protein
VTKDTSELDNRRNRHNKRNQRNEIKLTRHS